MSAMTGIFQRFHALFSDSVFVWLRYTLVVTLAFWIIFKLSAIASLLQHQEQALLKNGTALLHQQTTLLTQLNRIENKLIAYENAITTHRALSEDIKACRTQLDAMKDALQHIQAQTAPAAMLSTFKHVQLSRKSATHPSSKKIGTLTRKKSLTHSVHHLPFRLLTIDSWNGECLVMVNHHGHIDLLSQGDMLAGWKVVDIDFDAGKVTFQKGRNKVFKSVW